MSGIFPYSQDGGLPPNPGQPNNPAQAFPPTITPLDTSALYYGNGCDVRLRPHVVNSLISEIAATADRAQYPYRASSLQNLEFAVRYLIQRGLARGALLVQQTPFYYAAALDPPALAYNDFMTITFVPQMGAGDTQNQGYVRVALDSLPYVPLLRNDGQELQAADLRPGVPFIAAYYQGAFHVVGLSASQVPLILVGSVNFWIRPDGNDTTGDGTANSADRAFRTINGAWAAVGSRYAASPNATIILRLGVPGDYAYGNVGPCGSTLTLYGDPNNAAAYRVLSEEHTYDTLTFRAVGCNSLNLVGVNFVLQSSVPKANGAHCIWIANTSISLDRVQFTLEASNTNGFVVYTTLSSTLNTAIATTIRIVGNNNTIVDGLVSSYASQMPGAAQGPAPTLWHWENIHFSGAGYAAQLSSSITLGNHTVELINTVGPRYHAEDNSTISTGQPYPGNAAGAATNFSTAGPGT